MKSDKEFLVQGSWINGIGLITRVVSPFLVILLARVFPPRELGLFLSFQALVLILSRASILGLDRGLLWHVARKDPAESRGLAESLRVSTSIGTIFFLCFVAFISMGVVNLPGFGWLQGASAPFLLMMSGSIVFFSATQLFSGALDGLRLPQYRVFIGQFLMTALVPLFAIVFRKPLGNEFSLAAGMLIGQMTGCLLFLWPIHTHFRAEPWTKRSWPEPRLWHYSLPLASVDIIVSILLRVDLWMVLMLLGPEKAALYAVMASLANGLKSVRQAFDSLIIPIVSGYKETDLITRLKPVFSYATNMVSSIQLWITCFILIFPREILSLAGKDYAVEVFAFVLLLLGNLVNGFLGLNGAVLLGMGKSRFFLVITVLSLAINLLCNWILIPRLGITGAALAATITALCQNIAHFTYVRFVNRMSLYERHLYVNAALEVLFLMLFFAAYGSIESLPLTSRIQLFALLALVLGLITFLKRRTFSLR